MTTAQLEYRYMDKSSWIRRGEWDDEPDKLQWTDIDTGLVCLIVRGPVGALCGYVGVPEGHPWYKTDPYADCHGGVTFTGFCQEANDEHGICHVGDDTPWWIGFDCAHSGDLTPGAMYDRGEWFSTYRNINYVKRECALLAQQVINAE